MNNLVRKRDGEPPFCSYIKNRLNNHLNFIGLFSGPPGSGKSYSSIAVCCLLDPDFDPYTQICFNFKQVMDLVNNPEFQKKPVKIMLWDEPQIEISNRKWQSAVNELVNWLFSTWRAQNIGLMMAAPYKDFLDAHAVKLLTSEIKCMGWDSKTKLSRLLPRLLQYNSDMKKLFRHKLYIQNKDNSIAEMNHWDLLKAPDHVLEVYNKRKEEFMNSINERIGQNINDMMDKTNKKPEEKPLDTRKSLTDRQLQVMKLLGQGLKAIKVAEMLNITPGAVTTIKQGAEKRGYKVQEYHIA